MLILCFIAGVVLYFFQLPCLGCVSRPGVGGEAALAYLHRAWTWLNLWAKMGSGLLAGGCGVGLSLLGACMGRVADWGIWSNGNLFQGLLEIPEWSSGESIPRNPVPLQKQEISEHERRQQSLENLPLPAS